MVAGRRVDVEVEGSGKAVGGEQIHTTVADERRSGRDGVEHPLQRRSARAVGGQPAGAAVETTGTALGFGQIGEMGTFGVVKQQRPGDRLEHLL